MHFREGTVEWEGALGRGEEFYNVSVRWDKLNS